MFIGDDEGDRLAAGEVGLVYIKSPAATRFSYFGDRRRPTSASGGTTSRSATSATSTTTAILYLTDRSANLIISGGVNIYPAEVDAVLLEHPAVGDVAMIGMPDDEWGETVLAVVELRAASTPRPSSPRS